MIAFSIPNTPDFSSTTPNNGQVLFIPDIDYIKKFATGNLGIADSIKMSTIVKNLSRLKNIDHVNIFSKSAGIKYKKDPSAYFKNGKFNPPLGDISLDSSQDTLGFKALEKSLILSIFETQKPYMEITKLVTDNFIRIEDIISRILGAADSSLKPSKNPRALGYKKSTQIPSDLEVSLSQLNSISKPVTPSLPNENKKDLHHTENHLLPDDPNYKVISTIYSTGEFDANVKYEYEYIDVPDSLIDLNSGTYSLPENADDIPIKNIVFGIYDSTGNQISDTIIYKDINWLLRSGKWFGQFNTINDFKFIYAKDGYFDSIGDPGNKDGGWNIKKRKTTIQQNINGNVKNINIDQPIVVFDSSYDVLNYKKYLLDYTSDKLDKKGIINPEKSIYLDQISNVLTTNEDGSVTKQIENIIQYGFLPSLNNDNLSGKLKLKNYPYGPKKILYPGSSASVPPNLWIDPESKYDMKIIKCDSSIDITYTDEYGKPEIKTTIIRFIKNTLSLSLSNSTKFDISVNNINYKDISEYILDNSDPLIIYNAIIYFNTPPDFLKAGYSWILSDGYTSEIYVDGSDYFYRERLYTKKASIDNTSGTYDISDSQISKVIVSMGVITQYYYKSGYWSTIAPGDWNKTSNFSENWTDKNKSIYTLYKSSQFQYIQWNMADIHWEDLSEYWDNAINYQFQMKIDVDAMFIERPIKYGIKITLPNKYGIVIDNSSTKIISFGVTDPIILNRFLPNKLKKSSLKIDVSDLSIKVTTSDIPPNQVRVTDPNYPFGKVIISTQIDNNQLAVNTLYSKGVYGTPTSGNKQKIEQIYRYMTSEDDTETYYLVEGVLSSTSESKFPISGSNNSSSNYYTLVNFIGVFTDFIDLLIEIFSKIVPTINSFLKLISNPADFITTIIKNKMGDSNGSEPTKFNFLSKKFLDDWGGIQNQDVSNRYNYIKQSSLSNLVHVDKLTGDYRFLMDGSSLINMFGVKFGIELKYPSIGLIFPENSNTKSNKDIGDKSNKKSNYNTKSNALSEKPSQITTTSGDTISSQDVSIEYSTGVYIQGVNYEYIYITKEIEDIINKSKDLEEKGELSQAIANLGLANNSNSGDQSIIDEINKIKKIFGKGTQPIIDILLSLVSLPLKVIKGIVEYILNFFKSLTDPFEIPSNIVDFVSFKWISDFFSPTSNTGVLSLSGLKFDVETFLTWIGEAASNVDKNYDLNDVMKLPWSLPMPKFSLDQFKSLLFGVNTKSPIPQIIPLSMLNSMLKLFESIVNAFMDLVWALSGLSGLISPPYLTLSKNSNDKMTPSEMIDILNGNYSATTSNYNFAYEIKVNGQDIKSLDGEQLKQWIDDNKNYQFEFDF